jgi:hypothetical protein
LHIPDNFISSGGNNEFLEKSAEQVTAKPTQDTAKHNIPFVPIHSTHQDYN